MSRPRDHRGRFGKGGAADRGLFVALSKGAAITTTSPAGVTARAVVTGKPKPKSSKRAPAQKQGRRQRAITNAPLQKPPDELDLVRQHLAREGKLARGYGPDGKPR
jgi:hypothetical protein